MNYNVRVYIGDVIKDISLSANKSLITIGSSDADTLKITSAEIIPNHLSFTMSNGVWGCTNKVTGETKTISDGDIFVLSMQNKIAATVFSDDIIPQRIKLKTGSTVTIGRDFECTFHLPDRSVGRKHAIVVIDELGATIKDQKSLNGTYVNNRKITEAPLKDGDIISIGKFNILYRVDTLELCIVNKKHKAEEIIKNKTEHNSNEAILFKRSPRLRMEVPTGVIEVQAPPSLGAKPEEDWLNPMMLISPISLIAGVANHKKQKKRYKNREETRLEKYTEYLEKTMQDIEEVQKKQLDALKHTDPSTKECVEIAKTAAKRLWERRITDSDFLNVRFGTGEVDSSVNIKTPTKTFSIEEDELRTRAQAFEDKYNKVKDAPVTFSLREYPIFGVVAKKEDAKGFINNIIIQLATHHCYNEVKLVPIYNQDSLYNIEWMSKLPHSKTDDKRISFAGKNKNEADHIFEDFTELFKKREHIATEKNDNYGKKEVQLPYYLFVITAPEFLSRSDLINKYLFRSKGLGLSVGVIFVVDAIEQLPTECELIINLKAKNGEAYDKSNSLEKQLFVIDEIEPNAPECFAQSLSLLYCESSGAAYTIPEKYSLFEMLGIEDTKNLNFKERWNKSDITQSVSAPLGIYGKNKIFNLDLFDNIHGPHGLVAGKTGSGKSEVLLSYLVALASLYHPCEIQFVIIDFKGGGMSDRLERLPHMNTSITNIDDNGINRSLESINAELIRRQKLLSKVSAKNIKEYLEKYKSGQVSMPLPHLVMVVDEFAELKQNYPDFMKDLVSAARIGRSLGVHLILATQSPAGVVDEQIWNNSNFKLSLMVLDESNSNAVLKSPLAAHITQPGRGYIKVGNGEVFELFQSGYGGVNVYTSDGNKTTQLDAVINSIKDYCEETNIKEIPSICLPPLPTILLYKDKNATGNNLTIGLFDDPKGQRQEECNINVFDDNTMIIGSAQSGKTNLLQTIIRTLTSNYSPEELNMYIVDFSSMFLKNYETLNHIGGVVTSSEDEKLKNLFKLLRAEIEIRKEKQLSVGVSSFAAYKEAGYADLPQIVVIIDNLTALKELYFQDDDVLLSLCSEGINYGITFIVGNSQTSGIGYKYLAHFSNRIALYCNDSSEYMSLFEHCRERLADIPGRALVDIDKNFYECQTYLAFDGEKEFERANQIKAYISDINNRYANLYAKKIPFVPDVVTADEFLPVMQKVKNKSFAVPLGIDYTRVEPFVVELNTLGIMGVSGRVASGKHNFLRYVINALDYVYKDKTDVYILDNIQRKLSDMNGCDNVKAYEILSDRAKEIIKKIETALEERYAQLAAGNIDIFESSNLLVLVINSAEMLDELCTDTGVVSSLRNITGKYKNMNVVTIIGNYENKNIPYGANEFVKKVKEDKHIVFFDNLASLKIFDVPLAISRQFKKPIELGDGYYMRDNECIKVKTVLNWDNK